jgi:FtsP/CotA-like multicopper oxidase with cupredoxin domain
MLKQGTRYRLMFHNRTDDAHPMHLHRHIEIAEITEATSGVIKDTVVVPTKGAPAWFTADQPGLTCSLPSSTTWRASKALLRYS